jgi:hypothetical protein
MIAGKKMAMKEMKELECMDNVFVYSLHHRGRTLHSIPNTRVAVLYNESATGVKTERRRGRGRRRRREEAAGLYTSSK